MLDSRSYYKMKSMTAEEKVELLLGLCKEISDSYIGFHDDDCPFEEYYDPADSEGCECGLFDKQHDLQQRVRHAIAICEDTNNGIK